jgi:hypothetical protein
MDSYPLHSDIHDPGESDHDADNLLCHRVVRTCNLNHFTSVDSDFDRIIEEFRPSLPSAIESLESWD